MCAEKDPLDCHRFLMVSRALAKSGVAVEHILQDGSRESMPDSEMRLLTITGRLQGQLFAPSDDDVLAAAYRARNIQVAHKIPELDAEEQTCAGLSAHLKFRTFSRSAPAIYNEKPRRHRVRRWR